MPFSVCVAEHVHVFFQELNPYYELPAGISSRMYHHFLLVLSAAFYSRCVQSPPHPLPAPSLHVAYPPACFRFKHLGMDADKSIDVKQLVARHPLCVPVVLTRLVAWSYKSKCHVLT